MRFLPLLIVVGMFVFAVSLEARAATITFTGDLDGGLLDCSTKSYCWDGDDGGYGSGDNSNFDASDIDAIVGTTGLVETLKEEAPYNSGLVFDVGTGAEYFYVKDGSHVPKWYVFDLTVAANWTDVTPWDGTVTLEGEWFGTPLEGNEGPISHVAAYGVSTVPVPPAVWLFGSGLLGLVGVARRKA